MTAISTDGGAIPRNTTLQQGLSLVDFGAITLDDFVAKACLKPARMLGFAVKGHLGPGADADLVVVDRSTRAPAWVIARGEVIVKAERVLGRGGRFAATHKGIRFLDEAGIDFVCVEPDWLSS